MPCKSRKGKRTYKHYSKLPKGKVKRPHISVTPRHLGKGNIRRIKRGK